MAFTTKIEETNYGERRRLVKLKFHYWIESFLRSIINDKITSYIEKWSRGFCRTPTMKGKGVSAIKKN